MKLHIKSLSLLIAAGFNLPATAALSIPTQTQQQQIMTQAVTPLLQKVQKGLVTQDDVLAAKTKIASIAPDTYGVQLTLNVADSTPLGTVAAFSKMSCPTNWMEANGQKVPFLVNGQLSLDNLMFIIETSGTLAYAPSGSNIYFALPDLRGEFIRGWNNGASTQPDYNPRRQIGSIQTQQEAIEWSRDKSYAKPLIGINPIFAVSDMKTNPTTDVRPH
ncbi:MAG: hypothetical protein RL368_2455, partial [Pseudomonadota bacterium]